MVLGFHFFKFFFCLQIHVINWDSAAIKITELSQKIKYIWSYMELGIIYNKASLRMHLASIYMSHITKFGEAFKEHERWQNVEAKWVDLTQHYYHSKAKSTITIVPFGIHAQDVWVVFLIVKLQLPASNPTQRPPFSIPPSLFVFRSSQLWVYQMLTSIRPTFSQGSIHCLSSLQRPEWK